MLKSVLKCMESIRIKKMGKKILYLSANSVGGGGGPAELVKSQLFDFFFNPSLMNKSLLLKKLPKMLKNPAANFYLAC